MARRHLVAATLALAAVAAANAAGATPASAQGKRAAEQRLGVPLARLQAALHCQPEVRRSRSRTVMLVTGTGFTGGEAWSGAGGFQETLLKVGHPSCYVDFPDFTTGDMQVAVQYLVYGIRRQARLARSRIAVYGISQGAVLPRMALMFWPSLRRQVSDVVAVAGTQHGTTADLLVGACQTSSGCAPAVWQQAFNSNLLKWVNRRADETPGPTAWTTVRTEEDEVVTPQEALYPTSTLRGATNISIQRVCPGRRTTHIGSAYDSVSFAVLLDAVARGGPADPSRLPADVCAQAFGAGLDVERTQNALEASLGIAAQRLLGQVRRLAAEPPVKHYIRR
jgi:triacylglycerol lipase